MDQDISCVVTYDLLDDSNINYVGFDNFKSAYEMGRLAAKVLLDAIDQEVRIPVQYCLDADLIVRNSCLELK